MADIITSQIFVDGEKGITNTKMNNIIGGSSIQTDFVASKPSASSIAANDQLLVLTASTTYARSQFSNVVTSVANQMTLADTVNNGMLRKVSGNAGDFVGGDNNCHSFAFVSKTAAYTLVTADVGKYIVCSGGSWALTLPAPASGLHFRVRNDMGISGTTGTITLTPTGGTIDGAASLALLPQQECTLITDGTNWRTFGRQRMTVLGTLDISSATASATVLLPAGYRLFVLDFTALYASVDAAILQMQFSSDGGSTFRTTGYYHSLIYNTASAAASVQGTNIAYANIGQVGVTTPGLGYSTQAKVYPGSATQFATWLSQGQYYFTAQNFVQQELIGGSYGGTAALMNAAKFLLSSGTINNMFLTVTGVV